MRAVHSSKGKDVLLYLMFVCVAFVFWLLLSLDSEVQRDYRVPIEIAEMPDSVTLITSAPGGIDVTVHGKGSQLIRFLWGNMPVMKVKFNENISRANTMQLSKPQIDARLRDYFGQGVQITSVRPDSISLSFTTSPGVKLPLVVNADVQPNLQSIISGAIRANVDSVTAYGVNGVPVGVTAAETESFARINLKDTTRVTVRLRPVDNVRFIPDKVTLTIPVEPLISKTRTVAVEAAGMPDGIGILTFPSRVSVNYLVAMSDYNTDLPIRVYADYSDINYSTQRVKINVSAPTLCHNVTVSPDSVEFILERK